MYLIILMVIAIFALAGFKYYKVCKQLSDEFWHLIKVKNKKKGGDK